MSPTGRSEQSQQSQQQEPVDDGIVVLPDAPRRGITTPDVLIGLVGLAAAVLVLLLLLG